MNILIGFQYERIKSLDKTRTVVSKLFLIYAYEPNCIDCHDRCAHRSRNDKLGQPSCVIVKKLPVGRGHVPAGAGTTKCAQTRSSIPSAAYAVGWDMSQPYSGNRKSSVVCC